MASSQYSVAKHTIMPLIFKITHSTTLSYLIRDPATSSLILLPSAEEPHSLREHVANIQRQFDCRLTHTFLNTNATMQPVFDERLVTPSSQGELKPELVGEISICFISAGGYLRDYNLVAATHITPTSTKFPVLFVGGALSVCSIDAGSAARAVDYMDTLNKLKYFPNETYLFPERKVALDDLEFAFALDKNPFVAQKIEQFKANSPQHSDCLIPTSILEEKTANPFLNPHKHASLLKSNDKNVCFELLRKMRQQWRTQ